MNDHLDSQLSALSDGEMTELELRSLLKQLENCSEAERAIQLQKWSRYQLVSEALSDERGSHAAQPNFATAVAEAIVLEPSHVQADADDSTEFDAPGIVALCRGGYGDLSGDCWCSAISIKWGCFRIKHARL
jgi:hypothetical protein